MKKIITSVKEAFRKAGLRMSSQKNLDRKLIDVMATHGNADVVEELLRYGANPDAGNGLPLLLAVAGHKDVASIEQTLDLAVPDDQAVEKSRLQSMNLLLKKAADVSIDHEMPLRAALLSRKCGAVLVLIEHGASIQAARDYAKKHMSNAQYLQIEQYYSKVEKAVLAAERQYNGKKKAPQTQPAP
jgi:hypothetical protein